LDSFCSRSQICAGVYAQRCGSETQGKGSKASGGCAPKTAADSNCSNAIYHSSSIATRQQHWIIGLNSSGTTAASAAATAVADDEASHLLLPLLI
jgi:hypothetical protein